MGGGFSGELSFTGSGPPSGSSHPFHRPVLTSSVGPRVSWPLKKPLSPTLPQYSASPVLPLCQYMSRPPFPCPIGGYEACMGLRGVGSPEVFAVLLETWLWLWDFFFFSVSCLLYQSRSRDLFIGWEYCVLSHKETQTGDCQLVSEEPSHESSASGTPEGNRSSLLAAPSSSQPHHVSKLTSVTPPRTALCLLSLSLHTLLLSPAFALSF